MEADPEAGLPGWEVENCLPLTDGTIQNCASVQLLAEVAEPENPERLGLARANRVYFGDASALGGPISGATSSASTDPAAPTRVFQRVLVEPGRRYRISWYGASGLGPVVSEMVRVRDDVGTSLLGAVHTETIAESGFTRVHGFFDTYGLSEPSEVKVAIEPSANPYNQYAEVAGLMLEDVSTTVSASTVVADSTNRPRLYHDADDVLATIGRGCEDTDGVYFRRHWRRICETRCPVGLDNCDTDEASTQCFREATVTITPEGIERGTILGLSGFAVGNYNYRVDSIGLNFVGTALQDCSESDRPSTCYSAGYIPFSIEHIGPYRVRNHRGQTSYEAPLFTGRIVHGRGLAAERYLTNPLSGADRALAEPYLHRELRGRPLAGTYRIRLWEEPGIRFDRLEDVQILLNYRYWTRLD